MLACAAIVALVTPNVLAQKNQTPVITQAVISLDGTTLFIEGTGFGSAPVVSLGGVYLSP